LTAIVSDASALVEYLLGTDLGVKAASMIEDPASDVHVPSLCDVEVTSALRGLLLAKKLEPRRALEALEDYVDLPLTRRGHTAFVTRILELRGNFSAYDATYLALSEALDASLLTCDEPFAKAIAANVPAVTTIKV
jgi:predicted nucleic acid-binding protein